MRGQAVVFGFAVVILGATCSQVGDDGSSSVGGSTGMGGSQGTAGGPESWPRGGKGGRTPNAGSGGTIDGGGKGGNYRAPFAPPGCWLDLTASCPPSAACDREVTVTWTTSGVCPSPSSRIDTAEVRRADGTLCYSLEATYVSSGNCDHGALVWKDPSGAVVATGSEFPDGLSIGCAGTFPTTCLFATDPACFPFNHLCTSDPR